MSLNTNERTPLRKLGYNSEEAAAAIGIHPRTLIKWAKAGKIKALPNYSKYIFPVSELERFMRDAVENDGGTHGKKKRAQSVRTTPPSIGAIS